MNEKITVISILEKCLESLHKFITILLGPSNTLMLCTEIYDYLIQQQYGNYLRTTAVFIIGKGTWPLGCLLAPKGKMRKLPAQRIWPTLSRFFTEESSYPGSSYTQQLKIKILWFPEL